MAKFTVTIDFESEEEMLAYFGSDDAGATPGTKRTRKTKAEKEAEAAAAAQGQTGFQPAGQAAQGFQPAGPTFTAPQMQGAGQPAGFPAAGAGPINPAPQAPQLHPIATAILNVVDKSLQGGQPADNIVNYFRQVLGPDAAQANIDQIKQVFIPRLPEATLRQIAPQLGIQLG